MEDQGILSDILSSAEGMGGASYGKHWVDREGLDVLLKNGASVISNGPQGRLGRNESFHCTVRYQNLVFFHASMKPIILNT